MPVGGAPLAGIVDEEAQALRSLEPVFPSASEVADLLPNAQLRSLPGQRHLGFAFDPESFAHTILEFTATH